MFAVYEIKRVALLLPILGLVSFFLRNGLLRTIGIIPLDPPALFGLFATAVGGMIAAGGCDERLPPLPRPSRRIAGRVIVATSLLVAAAVCLVVPLLLAHVNIAALVLWRNLTLTFGLTLVTIAVGGRGLAWVPCIGLLSLALFFGGGWESGWWRYVLFLITPTPLPGTLIIGLAATVMGIGLFARRGVGLPTLPD